MTKRYCDRCGQQIDEGVHAWYVLELHGTDGEFRHKELCEECYEYLCEKDEAPKADRKTESNSEKPNNCEVKNYCDDCLYADTCDSKEFFYACTSKATISKMEQVDEPKTQTETQNSNKNSNVILVYDGVSEAVRCAMCSNPNKSNRGCDGACSYDEKLYERIMKAITTNKVKDEPQYDFGEYADRLWKIAYERGKREALEQTEPSCDTCKLKDTTEWCKRQEVCRAYQPKDEPTISKMEQVDKDINVRSKDCETCKHYKLACELFSEICKYEPTTQTETQNSNLTFKTLEYCDICDHKGCEECIANALDEHCIPSQFKKKVEDECAKEYEELGLKELKELIEADRKTEPTISKMEQVDKDINVCSKTEPSFKVDGIGDDDSTIHAIAHLQKVGWLQEHDRALTEPQKL